MAHYAHLTFLFVLLSLNPAASEVYYITTTLMDQSCPGLCLTLSQFAMNSSFYLDSNTTLIFLPGMHYLNTVLSISNMDNFVMQSQNSTAYIACVNCSNITFSNSFYIQIVNLEFTGCGGNEVKHVAEFVAQKSKFEGQKDNVGSALEFIETTAQILDSIFVSNIGSYRFDPINSGCYSGLVGGAIVATNSTIDISQSKFEYNRADIGGAIFAEQFSIIRISDSLFINNTATLLGGVLGSDCSTIAVRASEFQHSSTCLLWRRNTAVPIAVLLR